MPDSWRWSGGGRVVVGCARGDQRVWVKNFRLVAGLRWLRRIVSLVRVNCECLKWQVGNLAIRKLRHNVSALVQEMTSSRRLPRLVIVIVIGSKEGRVSRYFFGFKPFSGLSLDDEALMTKPVSCCYAPYCGALFV